MIRRIRYAVAIGLAAALWIFACAPPQPPPQPPPPLDVEYAHCQTVLQGPICVVHEDRQLHLWIRSDPKADLDVTSSGHQLLSVEEIQGGRRLLIQLDERKPELVLQVSVPDGGTATGRLALRHDDEPPWLTQAETSGRDDLEATRQSLAERIAGLEVGQKGPALRILARLDRRAGDAEAAGRHERLALEANRSAGRFLEEIESRATLAYDLFYDNQLSEAREMLDGIPVAHRPPAEALFHRAYYGAVLANGVGDHQTALRLLDDAIRRAERLDLVSLRRPAQQLMAIQLQRLGRGNEAAALLARLASEAPEDEHVCTRAQLANNIGWSRLLALEAGGKSDADADPTPWLAEALNLFQYKCPQFADEPANVHTNLARTHLLAGRLTKAREHLRSSRRLAPSPEIRQLLWWQDIEAHIALGEGRARKALELYDDMAQLADATLSAEAEWRATIGRGRAHRALGQMELARRDFAHGEALLDTASLQVSITKSRADFVAQRELGTRLYLDLLLDQGRPHDAFEVARRSRSRILRGLQRDERFAHLEPTRRRQNEDAMAKYMSRREHLEIAVRDAWRLPMDELRRLEEELATKHRELNDLLDQFLATIESPEHLTSALPRRASGEVRLIFHPLPQGWVAFADDAKGLQAERLPELDPQAAYAELGRTLLEPFTDKIASADQVKILPYGILRDVDFHALPVGGDVLLASKPVIYGLDLHPSASPSRSRVKRGVVVADPGGDLAAARREARHVLETTAELWTFDLLAGDAAHADAVRKALATADLFHYAGHGEFAGWQSALPLAEGSRLTLGDILTLDQAPALVVLSGCETGRSADDASASTAGLAHAFLAAGSRSVIAATRPIADDAALALTSALYPALLSSASVPVALQQAQLKLRQRYPGDDWSIFRVFEP